MTSLGLCIGSSSISYALTTEGKGRPEILGTGRIVHDGDPERIIKDLLGRAEFGSVNRLGVTGRKFRYFLNAANLSEPEALEISCRYYLEEYPADLLVSAGAETVMVFSLTADGRIYDVMTGNKCASGTGEFFLQQLRRMDITPEEVSGFADRDNPFKVSGRCSVFCKSDCTHALNKGIKKEFVVAGLSDMMAGKIAELVTRAEHQNGHKKDPAVLRGGGTTHKYLKLAYLKRKVPGIIIPPQAENFEALGASLWGLRKEEATVQGLSGISALHKRTFKSHPPLRDALDLVVFKDSEKRKARPGETCVLGLDVGSTTTKAVIINAEGEDASILAQVYLRTNGNPVEASRNCYRALLTQVPEDIKIIGLGTTGSGRQIAGLHALTPAVINEIIAHAIGSAHFDPGVDTIFEIGGQDAKYTHLTGGAASDYAMNEACSAGTGSFLEEAAKESLNIPTEDIGKIALSGNHPTNFSDQCAAFINSDIKSAIQEGISTEDIVAGLVYSISLNYLNRVKGARSVGEKVFMQGGVCYNKAVPVAMAALVGKKIIVPPEPGLVGAFGVALDTRNKIRRGFLSEGSFSLKTLSEREVVYREPFICNGGKEKCDLGCSISRIVLDGKVYPFGGACNRYYNILEKGHDRDTTDYDRVRLREKLVWSGSDNTAAALPPETPAAAEAEPGARQGAALPPEAPAADKAAPGRAEPAAFNRTAGMARRVGINRSLLTNTYYPLYSGFFRALGFEVVSPGRADEEGIERIGAAFCFPVEQAHGTLAALLKEEPDILFFPNVRSLDIEKSINIKATCPFIHAESNYLISTFPEVKKHKIINPVLDFAKGLASQEKIFIGIARDLGFSRKEGKLAFQEGLQAQRELKRRFKEEGRRFLKDLEDNPEEVGVVLFGRAYNAFSSLGNKGIPHKIASRGYRIIPCDFLPFEEEEDPEHIYWANGEINLKAAKFVKKHPRLFGVYVTNFSCGPDSFVVGFFRKEMDAKPSLTLELDNHTADVGLDTRIEAFIDVVKSFIKLRDTGSAGSLDTAGSLGASAAKAVGEAPYRAAEIRATKKGIKAADSRGREFDLTDPHVHVLIPSMMDRGSQAMAAVFRKAGIRADAVPDPTEKEFRLGQGYTSGKECLPIIITAGSLIRYLKERPDPNELLVYFMPGDSGPCRFGSYYLLLQNMVEKMGVPDVAFLNLSQEDGYAGLTVAATLRLWQTIILTDILEQVYAALLVAARDRESALEIYNDFYDRLLVSLERDAWPKVRKFLKNEIKKLSAIPRKAELEDFPTVALINEMYVRRNNFARQYIVEKLADQGVLTLVATLHEWLFYVDYMVSKKLVQNATFANRMLKLIEYIPKKKMERSIKGLFKGSGLYKPKYVNVQRVLDCAEGLVTETLICESILITGTAIEELVEKADGIISIQPFGCMPGRIAEAILGNDLSAKKLEHAEDKELTERVLKKFNRLPFMVLDVDGQMFPPLIEAKLESFLLQVSRIHAETREHNFRRQHESSH